MPDKKVEKVKGKEAAAAMVKPKSSSAPAAPKGKATGANLRAVEKKLLSSFWNKEIQIDKMRVKDMVNAAVKLTGISPEVFYASAYQEGLRDIEYAGVPVSYEGGDATWGPEGSDEFPISGAMHYGVDTFGEKAEVLKSKGYLPKDFQYDPQSFVNEDGESTVSGNFRNNQDAMIAKAAMMRDIQDQVVAYAKSKGLKVDGDELSYLTMSGYNGGFGRSKQMINEILSMKVSPKDYVQKGMTSLKGIHKNIAPRMRYMEIMREVFQEEKNNQWKERMKGPAVPVNAFSLFLDQKKPIIGILASTGAGKK